MRVRDYRAGYAVPAEDKVRKVGNNTLEHIDANGTRRIILHETTILTFDPNGETVQIKAGRWRSNTTKQRMNANLPASFGISQRNFSWYIRTPAGTFDYQDGIYNLKTGEYIRALTPMDAVHNKVNA